MMKRRHAILFCLLPAIMPGMTPVWAQVLTIPYQSAAVTIDGSLQAAEWAGAQKVYIRLSAEDSIKVQVKHDMTALYLAFSGTLESANALFPEILLDPQLERGGSWVAGQWWLHVSATDCEHNGAYGVYTNCKLVQPGWEAEPNFASGPPVTDTVEIRIPFSTISFDPVSRDTMGIALLTTNTVSIWRGWPAPADRNIPSTWSLAVLSKPGVGIQPARGKVEPRIFPNPAAGQVTIESGQDIARQVVLTDITGKICYSSTSAQSRITVPLEALPDGLYILNLQCGDACYRYKVVKAAK